MLAEDDDLDCVMFDFGMPQLERVAFHEAGHGFAHHVLLGDLMTLTIHENGSGRAAPAPHAKLQLGDIDLASPSFGRIASKELPDLDPPAASASFAVSVAGVIEKQLMGLMAGVLAESKASNLHPSFLWRGSGSSDRREWHRLHDALSRLRPADAADDWKRLEAKTRALLDVEWPRVQRLAAELLVRREMDPIAVFKAIEGIE